MASHGSSGVRGDLNVSTTSKPSNRLSSSFYEKGETSLTNIWKTQQKYIAGNVNEETDGHEEYKRSLSFGVAENSPIPRSISKNAKGSSFLRGQKNHSERIRRSMGLLDQAATPGLSVPATPSSALKYSTYTPNKLPIPSQYDVTGILSHTPRRLKTPSTPDPMGLVRFELCLCVIVVIAVIAVSLVIDAIVVTVVIHVKHCNRCSRRDQLF
ncbi:uncharacterized protein LOC117124338 [Anneissia japonica]|uniref:uncharacterized protein LOC117124338 n=1 Tax=Anneissia japonica TaxID=1529436 RepID=UPI00142563C7|nr:uncharacterized protein LOC117124338 [Anneissia japonica]